MALQVEVTIQLIPDKALSAAVKKNGLSCKEVMAAEKRVKESLKQMVGIGGYKVKKIEADVVDIYHFGR